MRRRHTESDPFERIREAQDHRYDPGYFVGGRIDPMLTGARPNRYGWVLLIMGILLAGIFLFSDSSDVEWWRWLLLGAYALLLLTAGVKLLRRKRPKAAGHRR
jgi:hypothetical protein